MGHVVLIAAAERPNSAACRRLCRCLNRGEELARQVGRDGTALDILDVDTNLGHLRERAGDQPAAVGEIELDAAAGSSEGGPPISPVSGAP